MSYITSPQLRARGRWDAREIPPRGPGLSRYAGLSTGPGGVSLDHGIQACSVAYEKLIANRRNELFINPQAEKLTYMLRLLVLNDDGTYGVVDRRKIVGARAYQPFATRGRFQKLTATRGQLIDQWALGEIPFDQPTDQQVWEALVHLCQDERPPARTLRRLSEWANRTLASRHGIEIGPETAV